MPQRLSRSLGLAAITLLVLACTACGPLFGPPSPSVEERQQQVVDIVKDADPSASNVVVSISTSGTSQGLLIQIDHEGAVTSDLLGSMLRPLAQTDLNPVDITLYFFEPGTDTAIDIAPAADELGIPWSPVGSGGSWLAGQVQ
ncbi:hypothetical protein HDC94_000474 [Leifsonia sp. AK011]|uniref:hypothetical protein n=1 Tax=Leifsonia sp. AK011 TaxID=2723075 RepID=UPI0015CE09D3|nr:hypothetical protein [Leifsonia sp. AK011]NYF09318.1 hypothetical protein [Leifsonia sp. AK011]